MRYTLCEPIKQFETVSSQLTKENTLWYILPACCWKWPIEFVDLTIEDGDGPVKDGGWKDGATVPVHGLRHWPFKQRVRWFAKVLKEILRHSGAHVVAGYERPTSFMVAMHSGCLALPWPCARLDSVDTWMPGFSSVPFRRQTKAMDHLPLPSKLDTFPCQ